MNQTKSLLIELGTEELPVKALPGLADAFRNGVLQRLADAGIGFDAASGNAPLHTPRRLAIRLDGVAVRQPEQASEVLGPYLNIALDGDGQPTKALQGFATKAGVEWTALDRTTDNKGERFVYRSVKAGADTADLLPPIIADAIKALPIPKPMRWGDHDYAFARPVHWLVVLFGNDVVDCELLGVRSGRESRGHRFHHQQAVVIASPADYETQLEEAKVIANASKRKGRIRDEVEALASTTGGQARIDEGILDEVTCLTEWPVAIACAFERDFLRVPQEALIETMETNQKFFPVLDAAGRLSEHFIGVANIDSSQPEEVRKGYERVIRPRFADARFFFDEDLKQGLTAMNAGLASVTYQAKLGTIADKVERVAKLAEIIAAKVGVDPALARRAATLAKADLQSRMVNEFPELQGIAGRHYAAHDAALADLSATDRAALADALDQVYMPRNAGDDIARSKLGQVLAIAERLDTLAGGFAAGLKPTGNKDPFALRRNALGLARTLIEANLDLDLFSLVSLSVEQANDAITTTAALQQAAASTEAKKTGAQVDQFQTTKGADTAVPALKNEIAEFVVERLRGYYEQKSEYDANRFEAVAVVEPASLVDFDQRLRALRAFAGSEDGQALAAANKRCGNLLRKAVETGENVPDQVHEHLFDNAAERELVAQINAAEQVAAPLFASRDYVAALARLAQLRPAVDAFFDKVMVMADDPAVRGNRLALLKLLQTQFLRIADIGRLATG